MEDLDRKLVLVVEDNYLQAVHVCQILEGRGAAICGPFASAKLALDAMKDLRIDAAVLDLGLIDGDAYPIAEQLALQSIPFLFLTGYARDAVDGRYGSARYCPKPDAIDDVAELLAGQIRAVRSAQS